MSHHLRVLAHALQCLSKHDARTSPRGSDSKAIFHIDCTKYNQTKSSWIKIQKKEKNKKTN